MPILKFACLHWCIEVVFCSCFPYHECTQVVIFISSVSWIRVVRFHDMKSAMVFFAKPKPWKQQFQHKIIPQLNAKIRDNWDIIFIQQHPTSKISLNCPTFCLDSSFRCVLVEMFFLSSQFCWYWSNLIRNKTPLSYFNVSENRKIFWLWFVLILFAGKTYIISKFKTKYTLKAKGLYVWLHYWEGLSAFCTLHHQQTGRVHVTISGINQLII